MEIVRRLSSTSLLLVVSKGPIGRIAFGLIVSLLTIKMYADCEPFISDSDDMLAEMLQWLVSFNLLGVLLVSIGVHQGSIGTISIAIQILSLIASGRLFYNDITRERKALEFLLSVGADPNAKPDVAR